MTATLMSIQEQAVNGLFIKLARLLILFVSMRSNANNKIEFVMDGEKEQIDSKIDSQTP
jgi:hypothetical protein